MAKCIVCLFPAYKFVNLVSGIVRFLPCLLRHVAIWQPFSSSSSASAALPLVFSATVAFSMCASDVRPRSSFNSLHSAGIPTHGLNQPWMSFQPCSSNQFQGYHPPPSSHHLSSCYPQSSFVSTCSATPSFHTCLSSFSPKSASTSTPYSPFSPTSFHS